MQGNSNGKENQGLDMRFTNLFLGIILLVATGSAAHASLSAINIDRLPPGKDVAQLLDDLKVLETVAENWSPEWRHELPKKEAVSLAERTLRKIDTLLSENEASGGELLLLKGLTAHYAYNLDVKECFETAVESLQKARKTFPADCRPLWFLGTHYVKAAEPEKGVPLLKQAAEKCGDNLPLAFWEDYAYAAVLAAMPAAGSYALDRVKAGNGGVLTERITAVAEGLKRRLVSPVPGKEYELDDVWRFEEKDGMARLVNGMYGFMVDVPVDWRINPFGVQKGRSGIGIRLPKKGKWPPPLEVVVFVSPASPETAPEKVLRKFLAEAGRKSFSSIVGPAVSTNGKFLWVESRRKKGSRVVAGIVRRQQPAYPGLLFESPHNLPQQKDNSQVPRYYTPVKQLTRLQCDLDYLIMIEGAPAAFDQGHADLELLLRNLVIE